MTDALTLILADIRQAATDLERVGIDDLPTLVASRTLIETEVIRAQLRRLADTAEAARPAKDGGPLYSK